DGTLRRRDPNMPSPAHDAHHHDQGVRTPAPSAPTDAHRDHGQVTLTVATGSLACEGCATCVEERLRENPHVVGVHVHPRHEVAHVTVHEGMVTTDELAETIATACGNRNPVPLPKPQVSAHAHAHTARPEDANRTAGHTGHGAAPTAPIDEHAAHAMT